MPEQTPNIPRANMSSRERELRSRLAQLISARGLIRATLNPRDITCGKSRCKCARGEKHTYLYLVAGEDSKRRQLLIPKSLESKARQWVQGRDSGDRSQVLGLDPQGLQRSAADRLAEFLTSNRLTVDKAGEPQVVFLAAMRELNSILRDFNKECGLEPGKGALTMRDILCSNPAVAGGKLEPGTFTAKLPPGHEEGFRALMDRLLNQGAIATIQRVTALEGRGELGTGKLEAGGKLEGAGRETGGKPDAVVQKAMEMAAAAAQTASTKSREDITGQTDAQGRLVGRSDMAEKILDGEKKPKGTEDKEKERAEREAEQRRMQELALIALREQQIKEQREQAEKEKERVLEQDKKKDDDRRRKYKVREKDTLESIASKQLGDAKLAGLIYEINQNAIPVKKVKGKKLLDLQPKLVIWLPSQVDIKEYRSRKQFALVVDITYGGSRTSRINSICGHGARLAG